MNSATKIKYQSLYISILAICVSFLTSCGSGPIVQTPKETGEPDTSTVTDAETPESVMRQLGVFKSIEDLGFNQHRYNSCTQTRVELPNKNCRNRYLTVVHFQLLCRDTDGTVSNIPLNLNPIVSNRIRWSLGSASGGTSTDHRGFGQLKMLSDHPTGGKRLILKIGKQFVGLMVNDISKLILPKQWCHS